MKKMIILIFVLSFIVPFPGETENFSVFSRLSILDEARHSSREFFEIIKTIRYYNPRYTDENIADMIALSYYKIRGSSPDISIYKVAEGIERFSSDKLGIDLKSRVMAYIKSQV